MCVFCIQFAYSRAVLLYLHMLLSGQPLLTLVDTNSDASSGSTTTGEGASYHLISTLRECFLRVRVVNVTL
jgi:hypothetical protein